MAQPITPIPKLQLTITMLIQAAESLSATVIFPFVPQFVQDTGVTGGDERKIGYWAGVLESVFFVAEFASVYAWGRVSDHIGRRPVLLLGPLGLAFSLIGFGWSTTFSGLFIFRCAQGVFNGNIGVVKTVMAEFSDATNLAQTLSLIPIAWSSGTTLGPIIGGLLSNPQERWPNTFGKLQILRYHPYLLPCAAIGLLSLSFFFLALIGLKESSPVILARNKKEKLRAAASAEPTSITGLLADETTGYGAMVRSDVAEAVETPSSSRELATSADEELPTIRELLVPRLVIPLLNYGFYCFLSTAYQVLFPLMYSTSIPNGGLGFNPYQIGVTRGVWGVLNTLFLLFIAARLIRRFGVRNIYIFSFANFAICLGAYPLLNILARRAQRVDALVWAVVVVQGISNITLSWSYATVQMYIVNSAPQPSALSSTNSIAQMTATILRALAPFLVSSLFAASLEWNVAGGYVVYIILLCVVAMGIYSSFLLAKESS
ncbi:major facilitator superfamily domain-containing protein [Mycena pura]|uniref:Major facilitator superfamily domain-containing protein n=1 Tax=Mycena pura TaxID=153505 RepID=A0AAD6Y3C2_9AGAR|nr:major facilitator superfamily domain-containing protein [Mycena pura]